MKAFAFAVVVMSMLFATVSAQAFPFGKKSDDSTATAVAADSTKSSSGVYLSDRFRALDTNHDGKVSQEEFLHDVTEQFKAMDVDKNSSLSPDEVDFPPGTPEQMKTTLRSQLEQRETMMKKRRTEQEARMKEDIKKMHAEQDAAQKGAAAATPVPAAKTETVKAAGAKAATPVVSPVAAKPPVTSAVPTQTPAFTSASTVKAAPLPHAPAVKP